MEVGIVRYMKIILLITVLSGYLPAGVDTQAAISHLKPHRLLHNWKVLRGPLRFLRDCRRQLTFIASTALGTFLSRVIKESPLTPLPLPPAEDPPRWNFLTLPLHFSVPYIEWMKGYMNNPQHFLKESGDLPPSWRFKDSDNSINMLGRRRKLRTRRDMLRTLKVSPQVIAIAVRKALKSLQHKRTSLACHISNSKREFFNRLITMIDELLWLIKSQLFRHLSNEIKEYTLFPNMKQPDIIVRLLIYEYPSLKSYIGKGHESWNIKVYDIVREDVKKNKDLVPTRRRKVYTDKLLLAPKRQRNLSLECIPSQVNINSETFQSFLVIGNIFNYIGVNMVSEKSIIIECNGFLEALSVAVGMYFVCNIEYPKRATTTYLFYESCILKLIPETFPTKLITFCNILSKF